MRRHRRGELHQLVIEQRRPRLDRVRHRHPIDLGEDVERQVVLQIAVLNRAKPVAALWLQAGERRAPRVVPRDLRVQIARQELAQLTAAEHRGGVDVAVGKVPEKVARGTDAEPLELLGAALADPLEKLDRRVQPERLGLPGSSGRHRGSGALRGGAAGRHGGQAAVVGW